MHQPQPRPSRGLRSRRPAGPPGRGPSVTAALALLLLAPLFAVVSASPGVPGALQARAAAQEAATADTTPDGPRAMSIVDLLEVPDLDDPRLSPDGERVVFVRGDADWEENRAVRHLWLAEIDGDTAVQVTTGEHGESSPRWSPDGTRIAFLAKRGEQEHPQVHLLPTGGGEARQLTEHPTPPSSIQWSPDGEWIYYLASEEETEEEKARDEAKNDVYAYDEDWKHRHLWRVRVPGGEAERVTGGDYSVWEYALSRDGTMLALHRGPSPLFDDWGETEVWVTEAEPEAPMRRVTRNGVPEGGARLSPSNDRVLFTSMSDGDFDFYYNSNLFVAPVPAAPGDTVEARMHMDGRDDEVGQASWTADGSGIWFLANTGVRQELFRLALEEGTVTRVTEGDHTVFDWHHRAELGRHVVRISTPETPGEVHLLDSSGQEVRGPRRVTAVYEHLARDYRLPRQEAVTWEGADGATVEGLLFYPLDYREGTRYPVVVQTHGGPPSSDKFGFGSSWDYPQVLTAMGYFVFQPNYRGSTGYGDDFLRDMVGSYFDQSHRDVMTGVDHLIREGLVDGDRMAKMGWSAGGHMTNKVITFTDRFDAAASGAGASNWISMYGQSDIRFYRTPWFGGTPWEEDAPIDTYWTHSPLSDVHEVTTPTIFLVGENDDRVPMPQSVEMYRAVRHQGVPTHLYVAPREPHGWDELRHRLFKANVELDWFERWVRDRDYEWETAPGDEEKESVRAAEQVHGTHGGGG